jgi:hypothetical protein
MEYLVAGSEDRVLILDKGIIKGQIHLDIQGLEKKDQSEDHRED